MLTGIEFWSNVSDEEVDLAIEDSEAADFGRPPTRTSRFYAKGALQYLVPILTQKLTKQVCTVLKPGTVLDHLLRRHWIHS